MINYKKNEINTFLDNSLTNVGLLIIIIKTIILLMRFCSDRLC